MWVLITVIISSSSTELYAPSYSRPILHDTIEKCELDLDRIYSKFIN